MLADLNLDGAITQGDANLHSYYLNRSGGQNVLSVDDEANDIGYAGYIWNDERAQWHVRHRELSPKLGRWLQRDPGGMASDGPNLYQYAQLLVTSQTDPLGQYSIGNPMRYLPPGFLNPKNWQPVSGSECLAMCHAKCNAEFWKKEREFEQWKRQNPGRRYCEYEKLQELHSRFQALRRCGAKCYRMCKEPILRPRRFVPPPIPSKPNRESNDDPFSLPNDLPKEWPKGPGFWDIKNRNHIWHWIVKHYLSSGRCEKMADDLFDGDEAVKDCCLALNRDGNWQGAYKCFLLGYSRKILSELPFAKRPAYWPEDIWN